MQLAQLTAGTVTIVVEDGEKGCNGGACTGRYWDVNLSKPPFVALPDENWQAFKVGMAELVRSYQREGLALYGLLFLVPALLLGSGSPGAIAPIWLLGIFAVVGGSVFMRKQNEVVDGRIDALCQQYSDASTTFVFARRWTSPCKPKRARTHRVRLPRYPYRPRGLT